ncbi:MAG: MBL fold metallo-hydrolase [Nanoarchaeota archaeon]
MIYRNIEIKWLGQSGFQIKTGNGKRVYIDPYKISDKFVSEPADIIFITHSHYDHCSIEDIQKISNNGTIIVCPADVSSKMRHITSKIDLRIAEIGEKLNFFEDTMNCWPVMAYNLNKEKIAHAREEDWMGYILDFGGILVYHAGDSDLIPEMKQLSTMNIDIALLPVGGTFTMNAGEAAKAAAVIKPKIAIPMHYGTVNGVGSKSDADVFAKHVSSEDIEVKVLEKEE